MNRTLPALLAFTLLPSLSSAGDDFLQRVEHLYADSQGVKIHYARLGDAKPLVVMIPGFPDFWYTWRHQMEALAHDHTVVAMDQRGYNQSDHPKGVANYAMKLLVQDVLAVIRNEGREKAILIGHGWGAAVAWQVALNVPDTVERLVILSVPHPAGFGRELSSNAEQQADSQYARDFQSPESHESLTAEGLASWVRSPAERAIYVEAFERSDFEAKRREARPLSLPGELCASLGGFSLHAKVALAADDQAGRERLARYLARPPIIWLGQPAQQDQNEERWLRALLFDESDAVWDIERTLTAGSLADRQVAFATGNRRADRSIDLRDPALAEVLGLECADFNGDGGCEVVIAWRSLEDSRKNGFDVLDLGREE